MHNIIDHFALVIFFQLARVERRQTNVYKKETNGVYNTNGGSPTSINTTRSYSLYFPTFYTLKILTITYKQKHVQVIRLILRCLRT